MSHSTLYKMYQSQRWVINALLAAFLALSAIWFCLEWNEVNFPMEPLVVLFGGLATLFANYWPLKVKTSSLKRKNKATFDYSLNSGRFDVGQGDYLFTLQFSNASNESIHIYADPQNIKQIAEATGVGSISEIKDASKFNFGSRSHTPKLGEIVVLQNSSNYFAAIQILDVKYKGRGDDVCDEVTFKYVINTENKSAFS